jgi:hypothetical protein
MIDGKIGKFQNQQKGKRASWMQEIENENSWMHPVSLGS